MARPSRYPDEFRREAVQMALATQDSRASVARRLTTLASTVENWWPAIEAFLATGITNERASYCTFSGGFDAAVVVGLLTA
jgi:transposase-like protein